MPLLSLPIISLEEAESRFFSPLADFGGYGIRRNREMLAFFLQGDRGVKLTTAEGKAFLIDSHRPDHLVKVIQTAIEQARRQLG